MNQGHSWQSIQANIRQQQKSSTSQFETKIPKVGRRKEIKAEQKSCCRY